MNINQIRYFLAIVECGSFRQAAETLSISQPALSNSIKTLEESLQVQLLERRKNGALPTSYGKVLYNFFKSALESVQRGREEVELMREGSTGHVNIGAPTGMIDLFLPSIMERMLSQKPGVTFGTQYGYLDNLLQALRHGQLDFLLTPYWPETTHADDLKIEELTDIYVSIYARESHPLTKKKGATIEDLLEADWIFAQSEGMQAFRLELFGAELARSVKCTITHNHPPFMVNMLEKWDLLSIIPDYTVNHMAKHGSLKIIDYPAFRPSLSAGLIHLTDRHITPAMKLFADTARDIITDKIN
jgi:LysR family transcriptional regulator of abg operon